MYAENAADFLRRFRNFLRRDAVNENAALFPLDFCIDRPQRIAHAIDEHPFEIRTIQPLQMDFRIPDQKNLFHCLSPSVFA